jgi:predicted nuclease of restriction endonuclease-like (RecB) superfamily
VQLTTDFGEGFDQSNLRYMRRNSNEFKSFPLYLPTISIIQKRKTMTPDLHIHFSEITKFIRYARYEALKKVNTELIDLYWRIGQYISERTVKDNWGKSIVVQLAKFIAVNEPNSRGFSDKNLWRMKQFFETYHDKKEFQELIHQISWSNNLHIFSKTKSDEEKTFYFNLVLKERLDARSLERHINSAYFERTMLANQKLSTLLRELPQDVTNVFKDTYTFEFLNLPQTFSEKDLKKGLIKQLKKFVLELGNDFVFMGEEYRLQVGNKDFYVDLLFYHRELCCLVPFELKIEEFKPEFIGKLNFYLEALDRDVQKPHENPSIGVLLCKSKDDEIVEYAMSRNISPTLVADYETKFIDKKLLQAKLHNLFDLPLNDIED